jgi:hypothetical protein
VQWDDEGNLYTLSKVEVDAATGGYAVSAIGPEGVRTLGDTLVLDKTEALWDTRVEVMHVVDGQPYLILTANGEHFAEPQLSVLGLE